MIVGVFVGGASRRMGGRPKGLLLAPPEEARPRRSIVERTVDLARGLGAEVVLVGRADAYAQIGVPSIDDALYAGPAGAGGPLAGLVALLEHAKDGPAIAVGCDMPYLRPELLARLAAFAPGEPAVAPREGAFWSPLFARYDARLAGAVARARLEAGERSLRVVLEAVRARELPLTVEERASLRDWDEPADIDAEGSGA